MDPRLFQVHNKKASLAQNSILQAEPSNVEIKNSVFNLNKSSSPGPDGFSDSFFCSCWDIVGMSVIAAVKNFFMTKKLLKASNSFFISLSSLK